jgi:hypothetical protein
VHSERNALGNPFYRERHGVRCRTNGRSLSAERLDWQIAEIWRSIEFEPDWRERMTDLASLDYEGPDIGELNERRRRLARAYADGGFSEGEYLGLRKMLDQQLRNATTLRGPSYEEAAEIFGDMPALWERATADEQRTLLNPLVERIYIDIESQRIGAITPTAGFRSLLEHAVCRTERSKAVLLTAEETRQVMSGLELVETGEVWPPRSPEALHAARCSALVASVRPRLAARRRLGRGRPCWLVPVGAVGSRLVPPMG